MSVLAPGATYQRCERGLPGRPETNTGSRKQGVGHGDRLGDVEVHVDEATGGLAQFDAHVLRLTPEDAAEFLVGIVSLLGPFLGRALHSLGPIYESEAAPPVGDDGLKHTAGVLA